ncbi:FecR domain-containing protein [Pseudomonas sp. LRF_L74]|uniref:FecR domain-containing protein n=1 Tax=Pseudomonas sp. LRF_L74 TaxID=3369422 RepID=UPI003F61160D
MAANDAIDYAVLQRAAHWFSVLQAERVSAAQRDAWQAWLDERPEHALAWQRVERVSRQFDLLPAEVQRGPARIALQGGSQRRQVLGLLVLGCGALFGGLAVRNDNWRAWMAQQRTATGEVRQVSLADGGLLWLGSASALDIEYDAGLRRVRLYAGELCIRTAVDPRPLVVDSAQGRMRALGTRFSVRQEQGRTRLNVFEGAVEVCPAASSVRRVVQAGQQVMFSADAIGTIEPVQRNREAWTRGMLQADDMRLGDFIEELTVYFPGYLGCDPAVADLRLVGAYPLAEPERILAALAASLPVQVNRRLPWWVSIGPRNA